MYVGCKTPAHLYSKKLPDNSTKTLHNCCPYSYHLKQRILSPICHLSNDQAAQAVLQTWRSDSVRWCWLPNLSRTNNIPKLALQSMLNHLTNANANLS